VESLSGNGNPGYAAPESHLWAVRNEVLPQSRWRDLWSFGCVLFEVWVWVLGGEMDGFLLAG